MLKHAGNCCETPEEAITQDGKGGIPITNLVCFFYKWIHEDFDFHVYFCLNHVSRSSSKADQASH